MITKGNFGKNSKGEVINTFELVNDNGTRLKLSEMGAAILNLFVRDKNGEFKDVVLGFDDVTFYEKYNGDNHGSCVGRIANRTGKGKFSLDGKEYQLAINDGENNLHCGPNGYNSRRWVGIEAFDERGEAVKFTLISPDGDQGMPGELILSVTYILTNDDEVILKYDGVCDRKSVCNPTNHSYFNLAGHASGEVYEQLACIDADYITKPGPGLIPTGELLSVEGTALDFRKPKKIGQDYNLEDELLSMCNGYDHNFVLNNNGKYGKVASLYDEKSGRYMEVFTNMPGIQMYTGNYLGGTLRGKEDCYYKRCYGVCFETQFFPDAVNHKEFASPVCEAGVPFQYVTAYKFSVK